MVIVIVLSGAEKQIGTKCRSFKITFTWSTQPISVKILGALSWTVASQLPSKAPLSKIHFNHLLSLLVTFSLVIKNAEVLFDPPTKAEVTNPLHMCH